MSEPSEKILRRIRAVLDRAEHGNTPEPERELALTVAAQLMADYGIQRAMLGASASVDDPIDQTIIDITGSYSHEKGTLLHYVATALRCKAVRYTRGRVTTRMVIVGSAIDRERVNMLFTSLLLQAERDMSKEVNGYGWAADTRARRAGFLIGFAVRIQARLVEAEQRAARTYDTTHADSGAPGTALVLADQAALIDRRFAEMFPHLRTGRKSSREYDADAWERGEQAGQRADIGTTRMNGTRAPRLESTR